MTTTAITEGYALAEADDLSLARRFAAGDVGAFQEVVSLYQVRVRRLAHRLLGWCGQAEADDVVQDVFLAALLRSRSFRGDASLWAWLTAITVNRCRLHVRRATLLRRFRRWAAVEAPEPPAPAPDCRAADQEIAGHVRAAVAALPPRDREVVVLYYLELRPVAEISSLLGASPGAIDVRLHRAREKLRAALTRFARE